MRKGRIYALLKKIHNMTRMRISVAQASCFEHTQFRKRCNDKAPSTIVNATRYPPTSDWRPLLQSARREEGNIYVSVSLCAADLKMVL